MTLNIQKKSNLLRTQHKDQWLLRVWEEAGRHERVKHGALLRGAELSFVMLYGGTQDVVHLWEPTGSTWNEP